MRPLTATATARPERGPPAPLDAAGHLRGHDAAGAAHVVVASRLGDARAQALRGGPGEPGHAQADELPVGADARVQAGPVARPELAQPTPDDRASARSQRLPEMRTMPLKSRVVTATPRRRRTAREKAE